MAEYITKDQVIDWFRCYGHMDKPIPYDVLVTDIQAMDSVDAANLQQNDNCAAIAQQWTSVTEELPKLIPCSAGTEYSEAVNVLTSGRKVITAIWDGTYWIGPFAYWDAVGEKITHWAPVPFPLPQLPKEVPENETL